MAGQEDNSQLRELYEKKNEQPPPLHKFAEGAPTTLVRLHLLRCNTMTMRTRAGHSSSITTRNREKQKKTKNN
jgi:hypothetical protein